MVRKIIFSIILMMSICSAQAQMQYVNIGSRAGEVPVYEYGYVDVCPSFPGGDCGLVNFINKTRQYPADAREQRIQGRVLCGVVIGPNGLIEMIEVLKSVSPSIDNEAVRIIREMPSWTAGRHGGKNVHVRCVIPIPFRL